MAASALGALWGFGHSTGQLMLGLGIVLLKVQVCVCVQFVHLVACSLIPNKGSKKKWEARSKSKHNLREYFIRR
jgi:hypothetical protein